jgi:dCMP deaminase
MGQDLEQDYNLIGLTIFPTFVNAVRHGYAEPDDIEDWVSRWHDDQEENKFNVPLHQYLGFTEEEYAAWVKSPDCLRVILHNHVRPSFPELYMELALSMSKRSTCTRLQVGCAIVSSDYRKVYAVGYNGNASGLRNLCDSIEVGNCGCLHAEENAVINCDVPREREKIVFCTHLPCKMCAKRLINLGGVMTVYYKNDYRKHDALEVFDAVGIQTIHMEDR